MSTAHFIEGVHIDTAKKEIQIYTSDWTVHFFHAEDDMRKLLKEVEGHDREENIDIATNQSAKTKLFMDIFSTLCGQYENDIQKDVLFGELVGTGRFTLDDCNKHLKLELERGQIYERRKDVYAKT